MSHRDNTGRKYGAFYGRTRELDLSELSDCMYRVLTRAADAVPLPGGTEFALAFDGERNFVVKVLNLTDEFLFNGELHTCEADELHNSVEDFFEAFNWSNPDDGLDRRFFFTVHLLSEAQQREHEHRPGLFFHTADS